MFNGLIDAALTISNVISIKENHTEANTPEEREKQRERRKIISDVRNILYLVKRL